MRKPLLLLAGLALVLPALASAAGGSSIANASELSISVQQYGGAQVTGRPGMDYWWINLAAGDELVVNYGFTGRDDITGSTEVALCTVIPGVTDYTLPSAKCAGLNHIDGGKGEFTFIATVPGRWTLLAGRYWNVGNGGCIFRDLIDPQCDNDTAYELTAYLKHYTKATIAGPKTAKPSKKVVLKGTVSGLTAGRVVVQKRIGKRMKSLGLASIKSNGTYSYRVRLGQIRGLYRFRAVYYGDDTHRASTSRIIAIRVV
jgi:hypothetical protein